MFRALARILGKLLFVLFTLCVIGVLSLAVFAHTFLRYANTQIIESGRADIDLAGMPVNLSSTVWCYDKNAEEYVQWVKLETSENRTWVNIENVPEDFQHAFVAIEDQRFYQHSGVDWKRTAAAGLSLVQGKRVFGGSTITQQLLKNLTSENQVTIKRKLIEICRALQLEKHYSKDQILEWYMNIIYFGRNCYGIAEAANYYFGKDVDELSVSEMCSIVAITNNPSLYDPYNRYEKNQGRKDVILMKMHELGYLSDARYRRAQDEEVVFSAVRRESASAAPVYPYYVDAVIDDVIACFQEQFQVPYKQASSMLYYGGYNIYACVDMDVQRKMDEVYQDPKNVPIANGKPLQSSMIVLDPKNGYILGMEGGLGEKTVARGLNWASGNLARRPCGSSIKPLTVYGPAIESSLVTPDTRFLDSGDIKLSGSSWLPKNDSLRHYGVVSVRYGLVHSLNTIAAQVLDRVGPSCAYAYAEALGLGLDPNDEAYAPMAVGQLSVGTTVRELAGAYSVFPNMGSRVLPRMFSRIEDSTGSIVYENAIDYREIFSDKTAYWVTDMLSDAVRGGTGYEARLDNMPCAGKTGTTENKRDRWFAGYTPYYVGAVWCGFETPARIEMSSNPAAVLWKKVMVSVHDGLEPVSFSKPDDVRLAPVPGYSVKASYTIVGVCANSDGSETEVYRGAATVQYNGDPFFARAPEIDGYVLDVSRSYAKVSMSSVPEAPVTFYYVPVLETTDELALE